jgi:AcrR family transcriptional regulator
MVEAAQKSNSNLNFTLSIRRSRLIVNYMTQVSRQAARRPLRKTRKRPEHSTREHLLEVAGQVFAEKGFDRATGKEICVRAGENSAAVNYHFGGIENLYAEVVREAHSRLVTLDAISAAVAGEIDAEAKLAAVVELFVRAVTGPASASWVIRVMGREFVSPSPILEDLRQKEILPKANVLRSLVAELMDLDADHPAVARACISVLSPCFMLLVADRRTVKRAFPRLAIGSDNADELVAHFVRFALAGIKAAAVAARALSANSASLCDLASEGFAQLDQGQGIAIECERGLADVIGRIGLRVTKKSRAKTAR